MTRPLSELTGQLLALSSAPGLCCEFFLRDLRDIHGSVSFLELPEMRDEWTRKLHGLLRREAENQRTTDWREQVRSAWNEFFGLADTSSVREANARPPA